MKKLFFIFIGILGTGLFAQRLTDHFVVTTKGDTLYGHLKYQSSEGELHNQIKIKVNDTLKYTFKASEIVYFEEGLNEYYSFVPDGQKEHFFMRLWASGEFYELFEWEVPASISKKKNLIEYRPLLRKKGDTEFIDLIHHNWKKQLAHEFKDYTELSTDILKGRYPMDEMNHIIDRYNEWKEDLNDGF